MVSLLCGCCGDKPITSFSVSAVLSSKFDVDPCFYRVYEPKPSGENLSFVQFYCNSYSTFFQKQKLIFDTKFFIANCSVEFVNSPNVPLHVVSDNEQNNFWYELGSDFLTPFGETRIVDVPTPSEISAYLSRDLLFDPEDASDYFYFCFFSSYDFSRHFEDISHEDPYAYISSSPFFRLSPYTPEFHDLVSRGFVYDIDTFFPIFKADFLIYYSKFYDDLMNHNYSRSCFEVHKFLKKDYYAYLQNNSTAG